jgi:hypothetical protein
MATKIVVIAPANARQLRGSSALMAAADVVIDGEGRVIKAKDDDLVDAEFNLLSEKGVEELLWWVQD